MSNGRRRAALIAALVGVAVVTMPGGAMAQAAAPTKRPVKTQDDLPRHSYPVPGTALALIDADDATFNAWAKQVDADITATLASYDIQDRAALRALLGDRLSYQVLTGQNQAALATVAQIRALQDKPDAKLMSGTIVEAMLKARIGSGAASGPAYQKLFASTYAAELAAIPFAVAGNRIKEERANAQIRSDTVIRGFILQQVEPIVARDHTVSDRPAGDILWARRALRYDIPLGQATVAALSQIVAANSVAKPDIWAAREVTLTAADRITPVVAAVWDSGTDLKLFPGQVYTDPKPAGRLPYNEHGLAFDVENRPQAGWLYPLTPEQQAAYPGMIKDLQGFADLQEAIDSPAADALRAKLAALPSDQQPAYFERLLLFGNYLHGTHVAGIMARGNPAIRLAAARMTFDHRNVPAPPTDELVRRGVDSYRAYVEWFRSHGVRVVNMSWGGSPSDVETILEKNGIGKDVAERKALARHYFAMDRDGLLAALKSAPDILFVCAAGNSNADNGFEESIPSGFDLPNLLTVSAVDQAGDEATFTSYGKNVAVTANGYHVDSVIPGGTHLHESGTSMASPNVANLAAKLIALDPRLTPAQTIAVIRETSQASADGRRHNIDPRAAADRVKAQRKS